MPELAEVEITRRELLPLAVGRRILDFWTDRKRGLKPAYSVKRVADSMRGRKILNVTRRGKVIFFKLSGRPERMLAVHLGMSGRLAVVNRKSAALSRVEGLHWIHFRWRLSGGKILQFIDPRKFGRVWYGSPEDFSRDKYLGRLGRDARSLPSGEFKAILRSGRGMLKPFLLRQDKFSGIGNIIADESLWRAKIHPGTNIAELENPQITALYRAIQKTVASMLSSGGTSLRNWGHPDGRIGGYQKRRLIYGKSGQPCPRCGRKLKRIIVGGRGTTICPKCQRQ